MSKVCTYCGFESPDETKFCPECGAPFEEGETILETNVEPKEDPVEEMPIEPDGEIDQELSSESTSQVEGEWQQIPSQTGHVSSHHSTNGIGGLPFGNNKKPGNTGKKKPGKLKIILIAIVCLLLLGMCGKGGNHSKSTSSISNRSTNAVTSQSTEAETESVKEETKAESKVEEVAESEPEKDKKEEQSVSEKPETGEEKSDKEETETEEKKSDSKKKKSKSEKSEESKEEDKLSKIIADMDKTTANAVGDAVGYLAFTGFSKQALIHQLSSEYGDGYTVEQATAAVQALDDAGLVDWTAEAKETAENYLYMSGFSRQGLIDQMTSEYGDQFTVDEATAAVQAIEDAGEVDWIEEAKETAGDYLDMSGFSKQGLIHQMSSEYGDQFTAEQAAAAVQALEDAGEVDWNAEAVESAESYLEFSSFSRQELIDQLSSEYGDQFTVEQATYAADQVGLS